MTAARLESVDVSVVVPLKNEAASLAALHTLVASVLEDLGRTFEIVFVDDGSTDHSLQVLSGLLRADDRVRVVRLRRNFGKAAALSAGFAECRGRAVITMDADLQDDPAEIPNLLAALEDGWDVVSGWKATRRDRWFRRVASRLFNWATRRLSGLPLHDFDCGLKAYSAACVRELAPATYGEMHRFLPVLAHARGFSVTEIRVRHHPRMNGRSRYGWQRYPRALLDLFTSTFLAKYSRRPLHALGAMGLWLLGPGLLLLGAAAAGRLFLDLEVFGGVVAGTVLCAGGVQLLATGLVAELMTAQRGVETPSMRIVAIPEAAPAPPIQEMSAQDERLWGEGS